MIAVSVKNLACGYDDQMVLNHVSFDLREGQILALLGPSGCGKTTLLKALAGLVAVQKGTIELNGVLVQHDHQGMDPEQRGVGFIFQDYALFPHMTVEKNLQFGLTPLKLPAHEVQQRIQNTLVTVGLSGLENRYPHELSGGQQQRVAIARSLVCRPRLMLLDEPFSNIDSQLRLPLIREIRELLKSQNITAIFVTHNKEEAFSLADELAVFQQGRIAQQGEASAVYHQPANLYVAEFLGRGNRIPVTRVSKQSVLSPWGEIDVGQVPEQENLVMFIRPQWLEIVEGGEGQLLEQHFLGSHAHCKVQWQNMELDAWHADSIPLSTHRVSLRLRPHAPVVFAQEIPRL